ncbi:type II toxin-antitoxin system RelE/ParE family toxin [Jiella pelagia]|uniref:type II toxin-antitoxin system RelE/ParE family toxin n=1 Tax=Jiella pelagia TaxID=2986949 RepID=UPI0038B37E74
MRRIVWETKALREFDEALSYLAARNEPAALTLEKRISDAIALLARNSIGRPTRSAGVRQKLVLRTSYCVHYRIVGSDLVVLDVRHQRRKDPFEGS